MSETDPIPYVLVDRPPKSGDRVHVEYEAEYCNADDCFTGGPVIRFDLPGYPGYRSVVPAGSVKVIAEPVKVGDVIDAVEAESLPADSAVLCLTNGRPYVRVQGKDGLRIGGVRMVASAGGPCRVLHIGGGK